MESESAAIVNSSRRLIESSLAWPLGQQPMTPRRADPIPDERGGQPSLSGNAPATQHTGRSERLEHRPHDLYVLLRHRRAVSREAKGVASSGGYGHPLCPEGPQRKS